MTPASPSRAVRAILLLIAVLAILLPALALRFAPPLVRHHVVRAAPQRVVPQAELPAVEPVAFQDLDPNDARAFNATVPFVDGANPPAHPFKLAGDELQRARAIDCMAAAVLYEAGDDPLGQRAVAQVVINRVRHPAFPKTICGVVFQGAERSTGCQFTFTCDGALVRHHWLDVQWTRARQTATAALTGTVFKPVGYATHYHTDWVVPYWQSSLDKIAAVNTHLFFRWTGWWGTPAAFNRHVSADEPIIAQLAAYSDAHKNAAAVTAGDALYDDPAAGLAATALAPSVASDDNSFLLTLDATRMPSDAFVQLAARLCGNRAYCKVMGWTDREKTPSGLPLQPAQIASMSFSYLRDRDHDLDKALWNCTEFRRPELQCMKAQIYMPVARMQESLKAQSLPGAIRAPIIPADGLVGVRHKAEVTGTPAAGAKASPASDAP